LYINKSFANINISVLAETQTYVLVSQHAECNVLLVVFIIVLF